MMTNVPGGMGIQGGSEMHGAHCRKMADRNNDLCSFADACRRLKAVADAIFRSGYRVRLPYCEG